MSSVPFRFTAKPSRVVPSVLLLTAAYAAGAPAHRAPLRPSEVPIVAPTPPMGWNPWNAFRTDFDERRLIRIGDAMVELGLVKSGYRYLNIDDGWWLRRAADGTIEIRTSMFPSARVSDHQTSFKPFVDRLHALGLKAGIYTDIGRNVCSQHWDPTSSHLPKGTVAEREVGSYGHQAQDAHEFFSLWGFDYVKVDACGIADYGVSERDVISGTFSPFDTWIDRKHPANSDPDKVAELYAGFAQAARTESTHEPIVEICAWGEAGVNDWAHIYGNLWRTSSDIEPTWKSMLVNFDSAATRTLFAGPGHWNDPDMLEVGNGDFDQTHLTEARSHFSLWAILAAPLILSYDLTQSSPELIDVVRNSDVIAIDQDVAGNQGVVLEKTNSSETIAKSLSRIGSKALALTNRGTTNISISVRLADLHLDSSFRTRVTDLWHHRARTITTGGLRVRLLAHETALLRVDGRPINQRIFYLSDMPAKIDVLTDGTRPQAMRGSKNWVPAQIGFFPSGDPIMANSRQETDSLGVAPASRLKVKLDGEYERFLCETRVFGGSAAGADSSFSIYGDGKLLLTQRSADPTPVNISLRGLRSIELVAPPKPESAFAWRHPRLRKATSMQDGPSGRPFLQSMSKGG